MLRIGLTGGIGSGKSTVSGALSALGAVVVDADTLAREVVAPGSPGLAMVRARFGSEVVGSDGALDRPALAAIVFADPAARRDLEAITHPLIADLTAERFAGAPPEAVVVHDMPLLVEKDLVADYHLVLVVHADEAVRVQRLVGHRGMAEGDARARIAAQASDAQRRAAADVWLPNDATPADLEARVRDLWRVRLVPYAANLAARHTVASGPHPAEGSPAEAQAVARVLARCARLLGHPVAGGVVPDQAALVVTLEGGTDQSVDPTRLAAGGYLPGSPCDGRVQLFGSDPGQATRLVLDPATSGTGAVP